MKISKENLTFHNIKRFIVAYKRKFQIWLFSKRVITSLFQYNDSLSEFFDASLHIKEQFIFRIETMKLSEQGKKCFDSKECICGCAVPDLQLSDDACEGKCYPAMMDKDEWEKYKVTNKIFIDIPGQRMAKYI